MTDSQFLIKRAVKLSIEGDRLFKESKTQNTERLKNILTVRACCFWEKANELYDQAQSERLEAVSQYELRKLERLSNKYNQAQEV